MFASKSSNARKFIDPPPFHQTEGVENHEKVPGENQQKARSTKSSSFGEYAKSVYAEFPVTTKETKTAGNGTEETENVNGLESEVQLARHEWTQGRNIQQNLLKRSNIPNPSPPPPCRIIR